MRLAARHRWAGRARLLVLAPVVASVLVACTGPVARAPLGRAPDTTVGSPRPTPPPARAPVPRSGVHTVRRGETLYAIAWRYGSDYRALARVNGIRPPYTIYPGQTLRLRGTPAATSRASRAPTKPHVTKPKAGPSSKPKHSPTTSTAPVAAWQWPVRGKVIGGFGRGGGKGIDIAGRSGQAIAASAGGRVVYSGSGLRGYGKLIIIKHNDRYLSAYAHNKKLHVKEGDKVQRGQRIAEMGSSETDRVKLHFEIRRDGKPVDPLKHLPG